MQILFIIVEIILITIYIALLVEATRAHNQVKYRDKTDESSEDQGYYHNAKHLLFWCVFIGWFIVALAIVGIIIAIFFSPEETEAMKAKKAGKKAASKAENMLNKEINKAQTQKDNGLLGLGKVTSAGGFGGVLEKVILFSNLGILFAFGVLSAMAASNISKTTTKYGYRDTIIATILGIVPFSLTIVWFISNVLYKKRKQKLLNQLEYKKSNLERSKGMLAGRAGSKLVEAKLSSTHSQGNITNPVVSSPVRQNSSVTQSRGSLANKVLSSIGG